MRGFILLAALLVPVACNDRPKVESCTGVCTAPKLTELALVAGQPGGPGWVDGVGAAAHFSDPFTLANYGGRLFLADGSTLRVIDPATATVSTLAGSFGVVGGDDGVGARATFYQPSGLVAAGGLLYLTDTENHTIRTIDVATGNVTTIAGVYGVNGADDGTGVAARFREPEGLALDGNGILYIADTDNNSIRRMDLATGAVTTLAGAAGAVGNVDAVGDAARFNKPKALTLDATGNLYAIDSGNMSLRKVVLADATVSTVVTFATAPAGMDWDGEDLLLALDQRVVRVVLATQAVSTIAGATNQVGFVDGTGADARFSQRPAGILNDGKGTLYVADEGNFALRKVMLATGEVTTFAGARSNGSDDGSGRTARFWGPQGIVVAGSDIAYVADTNNHTIRKVAVDTGEVTTIAGTAGQAGNIDASADAARFDQPSALAVDAAARELYVADAGNHLIRKLDLASGAVTTLPHVPAPGGTFTDFVHPAGLALDADRLFVTDSGSHTLLSLDIKTTQVTLVAGAAMAPGSTDGTGSQARFYSPTGLVADGRGNLFVADVTNHAVRKIVIATGQVTTLAGALDIQGSQDGIGRAARFAYPSQLAIDGTLGLFVADTNNNTVRYVDVTSGAVTTLIGAPNLSGVRLGPLPAQITAPAALAVTASRRLALFSENALLLAR